MKRCANAIACAVVALLLVWLAGQRGKWWEFGVRYGMPTLLVSEDGRHLRDGSPLDPSLVALVKSGREEELWIGLGSAGIMLALYKHWRQRPERTKDPVTLPETPPRKVLVPLLSATPQPALPSLPAIRPANPRPSPATPPRKKLPASMASLDTVLTRWNEKDEFTRRHLLNGGVLVMGRPGSGKTSASGMTLGRAIVEDPFSTMLILAAKPEDADLWQTLFKKAGRELLVISRGGDLRCNMIDFIRNNGGDTREIVTFIKTAAEALRGESSNNGVTNGAFWEDEEKRHLYHAVEILTQARIEVSAPNIQRFITTSATSRELLTSQEWRDGFHYQCLRAAATAEKSPREEHDFEMARDTWVKEWPYLAEETRSCVLAGLLNKLFYFNTGVAREILSTTTTCSPAEMLREGKSILVNCPACEDGDSGALVSTCFKFITQKAVLARRFEPGDFYNIIWADEAWQVTTSFDQHYAATSRSHGGAMCYLVQSRDSFYSALKGESGKHFSNALMGMLHHKIFHSLGSPDDASYAVSLLGMQQEVSFGSTQPGADAFDTVIGKSTLVGSVLQPRTFLSGLRSGGPENDFLADAVIVRTGEPFASSGQNWIRATFSQKES